MVKKLTFGDIKIGKYKFYHNQIPTFLKDIDIEDVLVSNKTSFREKRYNIVLVTYMIIKLNHCI